MCEAEGEGGRREGREGEENGKGGKEGCPPRRQAGSIYDLVQKTSEVHILLVNDATIFCDLHLFVPQVLCSLSIVYCYNGAQRYKLFL